MPFSFNEEDLPEVVVDAERTNDAYTYVHVGEWHFCVEDDLEERDGRWWEDAKTWVAYSRYLDKVKAERGK